MGQQEVISVLKKHRKPVSTWQLVIESCCSRRAVSRALSKMLKFREVKKINKGRDDFWVLT